MHNVQCVVHLYRWASTWIKEFNYLNLFSINYLIIIYLKWKTTLLVILPLSLDQSQASKLGQIHRFTDTRRQDIVAIYSRFVTLWVSSNKREPVNTYCLPEFLDFSWLISQKSLIPGYLPNSGTTDSYGRQGVGMITWLVEDERYFPRSIFWGGWTIQALGIFWS